MVPLAAIQAVPIAVIAWYRLHRYAWYRYSAIVTFLDGNNFEDSIRNAISIGGDSDTLACITGSIAEAYFGVPDELYTAAFSRLTPHFKNVVTEFEEKIGSHILK